MNALKYQPFHAKLQRQRGEVLKTLDYVRKEQRAMAENRQWIDQAAFKSRRSLLESLADWYVAESARIDEALLRIRDESYGICLGCRKPIPSPRLDAAPDAAFCADCQMLKDQ